MSRKTKKAKILAEYHRKLQALDIKPSPASITQSPIPKPLSHYSLPLSRSNSNSRPTDMLSASFPSNVNSYSYVLTDLKRISVLAALAIGSQFVLWYLIEKHAVRLF